MSKLICIGCGWQGLYNDVLKAKNPFCHGEEISGCPYCKCVNTVIRACERDGCWKEGSCGNPEPAGYTWTCFEHQPNVDKAIAGCQEP